MQVASSGFGTTNMAFIGSNDILILNQFSGVVEHIQNGVLMGPVLDVDVQSGEEQGLLGIAVHPNFPNLPYVYLYYTEAGPGFPGLDTFFCPGCPPCPQCFPPQPPPPSPGNRVYRYEWNGSELVNRSSPLITLPATKEFHDGGILSFGPNGKLYVVIGDQDRNGKAQNNKNGAPFDRTGGVFRINEDGTVPSDNPFFSQGGDTALYFAYGVRNSFGMAFDPLTGKLWISVNGDETFDEIDMVDPGCNLGWRQIEGPDSRDPQGPSNLFQLPGSQYCDPKFSWAKVSQGNTEIVAPTGLAFLNSDKLGAQYQGNLFAGAYNTGALYRFKLNQARTDLVFQHPNLQDKIADNAAELDETIFGEGFGDDIGFGFSGITDVKAGPDGLLYVLTYPGDIFAIGKNRAPVANPQTVNANSGLPVIITLTGSDPDGDPITFSVVTLPSSGSLDFSPSSRATYTPDLSFTGDDSFTFKVNDGSADSNATVDINVAPAGTPFAFCQDVTRFTSGTDPMEALPQEVDAGSFDPDDPDGSFDLSLDPPGPYPPGVHQVTLRAIDSNESFRECTAKISVLNTPPNADAGPDQQVIGVSLVTLDGTGTGDLDGDFLTFAWVQTGGPTVTLSGEDTATPSFVPPSVGLAHATLTFELTATSPDLQTSTDTVQVEVQSSLSLLDHFQCYKVVAAKASKGQPAFPKFSRVNNVLLQDQFERKQTDLLKPLSICNPADKNGEGDIRDPITHLKSYQIKDSANPTQTPFPKEPRVQVDNQFGTLFVDVTKIARLLAPTSKVVVPTNANPAFPPLPLPADSDVDHYKCYEITVSKSTKEAPNKFTPVDVTVHDQFGTRILTAKKPTRLCNPVRSQWPPNAEPEEIKHPDNHLMCYKIVLKDSTQPKFVKTRIAVQNQFGPEVLDATALEDFCVPSLKVGKGETNRGSIP